MAVVPGTHRAAARTRATRGGQAQTPSQHASLPLAPQSPTAPPTPRVTPGQHRSHRIHAAWHWLWAAIALAVGHFIAGAGAIAWVAGPVVTVVALTGLVARRRWAHSALWIGLGLTLGVLLAAVLGIVQDDGELAMAGFGA